MPRGSAPGEYRGGRKKGTPNTKSMQLAILAEQRMVEARRRNEPMAKDMLADLARVFMRMAKRYEPPEDPEAKVDAEQATQYERWAKNLYEVCKTLLPTQTPSLKAVFVSQRDESEQPIKFRLVVYDKQRTIEGDPPKQIGNGGDQ